MVIGANAPKGSRRPQGHRRAPNNDAWKEDERDWAKFFGFSEWGETKRQQSTGLEEADIIRTRTNEDGSKTVTLVAEHKKTEAMPVWLIKAMKQEEANRAKYPGALSFICLTYHQGAGRRKKRLLVRVIEPDDTWAEDGMEIPDAEV